MKILFTLFFITSLLLSNTTIANDDAKSEAGALLDSLGMDQLLKISMEQMLNLEIQQNPTLAPFREVMMQFFSKHMNYESLKPDFVHIYSRAFTATELREINAFYQTEVGKKTIKVLPELMTQGSQIGVQAVQENLFELEEMIKAESERLEKLQSDNP